jgi:Kef-type K+ transport system membrane component KefB
MDALDAFYLPEWPPALPSVARIALLLLAAAVGGELGQRWLRLPRVVGQVAVGVALGPQVFGFVRGAALAELEPLIRLAIGALLFELGGRIDFLWLKRNPWLLLTSALEAGLSFILVFAVLRWFDVGPLVSALTAAIVMISAPEVIMRVTDESAAQGQVAERLRLLTALNCSYAVFVIILLRGWLNARYAADPLGIVLHPVYLVSASFMLAVAATGLMHGVLRVIGRGAISDTVALLGSVVLLVTAAESFAASSLISLLAFGALLRNSMAERRSLPRDLGMLGSVLTLLLFAATGALLQFAGDARLWQIAGAVLVLRLVGKCLVTGGLAEVSGITWRKGLLVGIGLAPLSALAIVMLRETIELYPELPPLFPALVMACVAVMQLIGPALTHRALLLARETGDGR